MSLIPKEPSTSIHLDTLADRNGTVAIAMPLEKNSSELNVGLFVSTPNAELEIETETEDGESRIVVELTIEKTTSENEYPEEFSFDLDNFDQSIIAQIPHQQNTSLFIKMMSAISSAIIALPNIGFTLKYNKLPTGWPRYVFFATTSGGD
ncbi:hypothetical protein [Candidatus Coxiella mudrowiae]|uniref:hypothetical protein n=1 Tax=Candidatus Coxiella mudrowiae TaxID=2054173 RepID=UPI000662A1E5|nr:hypothetical protein [Candidatus Coxiella mudrowiae]